MEVLWISTRNSDLWIYGVTSSFCAILKKWEMVCVCAALVLVSLFVE